MSPLADFLTSRSLRILVRRMRRMLRVRAAFEATRSSEDQLQLAYEQVVATARRTCTRRDDDSRMVHRADEQGRSEQKKEAT